MSITIRFLHSNLQKQVMSYLVNGKLVLVYLFDTFLIGTVIGIRDS